MEIVKVGQQYRSEMYGIVLITEVGENYVKWIKLPLQIIPTEIQWETGFFLERFTKAEVKQ